MTGEELGGLLAGKGMPVVILNACRSGMSRPEALYTSVGNELLRAGARGVVAMAYSVLVSSAARFMARLYEGLLNGDELGRAVTLAREDLRAHPSRSSPVGDVPLRDWVVPVLFEAAPVRAARPAAGAPRLNPDAVEDAPAAAGFGVGLPEAPALGFVGRDAVTLDLERAFRHETVVLLEGMAGVGKTEMAAGFARWWVETGALNEPVVFFFRFEQYLPLAQVCDRVGEVFAEKLRRERGEEWSLLDPARRLKRALELLRGEPCLLIWGFCCSNHS